MLLSASRAPATVDAEAARSSAAVAAVTAATVAFGSGPVAAALTPAPTSAIVVFRFVFAAPLLLLAALLSGRRLTWATARRCLPGGLLLPLQLGLFFQASRMTSVADATFIMSLQPALMLLLTPRLFRERLSRAIIGCTVAGIAGVGLVIFGSAQQGTARLDGELIAVANLLVWTAYLLVSKWARSGDRPVDALTYQLGVNLVGAAVMTTVAIIMQLDVTAIPSDGWLGIGLIAVTTGVVAHVLNTWSQRYLAQTVGSVILLLQPVVAMIGGAVFLAQPIADWSIAGAGVVVASAFGAAAAAGREDRA